MTEIRAESINQCIASFENRFGKPHLFLAYHAALPLAVTPDLLYTLWANFQQDCDGSYLNIPWVAVANLLLSSLFKEVGYELYEMDDTVRSKLLEQLKEEPTLGQKRILELSYFLSEYVRQQLQSDDPDIQDFARAQRWASLAYTQPTQAASELALALAKAYDEGMSETLWISSLVETLAEPLKEFEQLLAYAKVMKYYALGDLDNATEELSKALAVESDISVCGIRLPIPEQLRARLPNFPVVVTLLRKYPWLMAVAIAPTLPVVLFLLTFRPVIIEFLQPTNSPDNVTIIQPPASIDNPGANLVTQHPLYNTPLVTSVNQLSDIQVTDWFFQALQSLVERYGIIYPYEDGTYRGNQALKRNELIDMLAIASQRIYQILQPSVPESSSCSFQPSLRPFVLPQDVNFNDWYYQSYALLASHTDSNFTDPDNRFHGERAATRGDMAVALNKTLDAINESIIIGETSSQSFNKIPESKKHKVLAQVTSVDQLSDVQQNDLFFQNLQSLVEIYGCITGYPDGQFQSDQAITRGEFAAGLNACLDRLVEIIDYVDEQCSK